MKKISAALLILLLCWATAKATVITVSSYAVTNWFGPTNVELRVFLDRGFVTSDNKILQASSPNTGNAYLKITCSVVGTTLTIPSFTLDSTTDGLDSVSARYAAYFYNTTTGQKIQPFFGFDSFQIPPVFSTGTTTTWSLIRQYNAGAVPIPLDQSTYSRTEINGLISSMNAGFLSNPMTTLGDIIIGGSGGSATRLAGNSAATKQFLTSTGTGAAANMPTYQALVSGDITGALGFTPFNAAGGTITGAVTMTGGASFLTLIGNPTSANHAANKAYVDANAGILTLNGSANKNPTFVNDTNVTISTNGGSGVNTITWSGTLGITRGGLNLSSVNTGDLPYGSASNVYSTLADVATGNALISGGVGVAPLWGKIALTTHVSGILPGANGGTNSAFFQVAGPTVIRTFTFPDASATVLTTNAAVTPAQGGTGLTSFVAGNIIYATGASTLTTLTIGGATTVLHGGASVPSYSKVDLVNDTTGTLPVTLGGSGAATFSAGYVKSPGGTSTLVTQAVPIPVPDGGTGATSTTLNGVVYAASTSAYTATAAGASGTVLTGTGAAPSFSASPTLTGLTLSGFNQNSIPYAGVGGLFSQSNTALAFNGSDTLTIKSKINLAGSSSGVTTVTVPSAAGTYTLTLPANAGSSTQFLQTDGAGVTSWQTAITSAITAVTCSACSNQNGPTITFAVGTSGSDLNFAASANTITLNAPDAGAAVRGVLNTGTQTIGGAKTLNNTLTTAAGTVSIAPIVFPASVVTTTPPAGALETDNNNLFFTGVGGGAGNRKQVAYITSNISGSAASITGNLTGDVTSVGMATSYSNVVPLTKGGTAANLTIGAAGTFLGTTDGISVTFTNNGSGLQSLNAGNVTSGTLSNSRLSGVELTANKDAASGYAGLTAGTKLNLAEMQEVMSVADLTEYTGSSGSGSTALRTTITAPAVGDIITRSAGGDWVNSPAAAGTAHNLLSTTHTDTVTGAAAQGALVIGNATPKWDRLLIGSANTLLRSNGTTASWAAVNVGTDVTGILALPNGGTGVNAATNTALFNAIGPLTTKGDLVVRNSSDTVRQGVGIDDQILTADSVQPNGIRWGNPSMHPKQIALKDEFAGGGITVANGIGELGWQGLGGTASQPTSVYPNIGLFQLATGALIGNGANMSLGATANAVNGNLGANTNWDCTWIFKLSHSVSEVFHVGFTNNNTLTANNPDGIYLRFDTTSADVNFTYVCKSGGTPTAVNSGIAADTNFHTVKMKSTTAGQVVFTLDGANTQTISTNVPTATVGPFVMLETRENVAHNVQLDYFLFNMTVAR